jgi:hypothetical protein
MRISCLFAAVAAAVLVACGGSELSDEEEIRAVFAAYQNAAEDGDGKTLCEDVLAPSQLGDEAVEDCARGFNRVLQTREVQRLAMVELGEITIEGNHARAENATDAGFFEFRREKGRWGLILIR